MTTFLVTGGAGFIGTRLIKRLFIDYDDPQIVSLDNYSTGRWEAHDPEAMYMVGNTLSAGYKKDGPHFDAIFHFGEYSRIATSFDDMGDLVMSNVMGTAAILELWRQKKCLLVYSGSSSIFADKDANPYTFSKFQNVQMIKNYAKWFGLEYIITYFYNVYGHGQIDEGKMATVIGIFLKQYKEGNPLTIVSPGSQKRDFTHVEDIVRGISMAVQNPRRGMEYHLCTGKAYQITEIAQCFPGAEVKIVPERRGERFDSTGTPDVAGKVLGWQAEYDVKAWITKEIHDKALWLPEN